ncbi:DNA translocase FtsK [Alteromonadaceae bacterium M269]|nr:DNA translocase FtsK [Alteromonadaceae bacterium M269]
MARLSGMQRLLEVGMLISCALALFLILSLGTYNQADPGWSQTTGSQGQINNAAGPVGAWVADILFFFFGGIAISIPFAVATLGWMLFQQSRSLLTLDYLTIGLRLLGAIFIVLGSAGLASINFDDWFSFSAGGALGDAVSAALIPYFNLAGSILLLLCFFLTGITLLTGISWLAVIDGIGSIAIALGMKIVRFPSEVALPRIAAKKEEKSESDDIEITSIRVGPDDVVEDDEPSFKGGNDDIPAAAEPFFSALEPEGDIGVSAGEVIEEPKPKKSKKKAKKADDEDSAFEPKVVATSKENPELGAMPSFALLDEAEEHKNPVTQEELNAVARLVEQKLADFNVEAKVVGAFPGPVITRFELDLAPGVKVSKISGLSKDLARALSAMAVRVVEVIPGKSVIGLELPNKHREIVRLSEVITHSSFEKSESPLTMVLGKDISGKPVSVDLAKMPHLLVAGTTGSGKSVGVNVMILSLLYKSTPDDVRMIMIDPKMLELSVYEGIPHLLSEVVTDMKEAANALRWCVGEMERRYRLMSALGVRNLKGYNAKVLQAIEEGNPIKDPLWRAEESMDDVAPDLEKLPAIVVIVDEFADMMMIVGKKVEELIARIAQKARAAGIHLVLATQRPSVDVITGLIKANIPTRIAFQVSSKIDSRTILDQQGAEALLGMGDMLYMPPGSGVPSRVHGAFVDDHEVHAVVADWKQRGQPQYIDEILNGEATAEILLPGEQPEGEDQEFDAFYDEAVAFVTETRRASVSGVQRKFRIGYNRAARLVEQMEMSGVVSSPGHNGNREVLAPPAPRD